MVIQDQSSSVIQPSTQQSAAVRGGSGTLTLSDRVTIPAQGVSSVHIFLPLFPSGAGTSSVVTSVSYVVQARGALSLPKAKRQDPP